MGLGTVDRPILQVSVIDKCNKYERKREKAVEEGGRGEKRKEKEGL